MAGRIVLFGATGYTGELTARELAGRGERPVLAARSAERVGALAAELGGLEWIAAQAPDLAALRDELAAGDVLVSTVGPFTRLGEAAVAAAVATGAHYVDCAGEAPFLRAVFERWGPRAAESGSVLLPAMGYDYAPGNLAGALALREAGPRASAVSIGYFTSGMRSPRDASGGTRASVAAMLFEPGHTWRRGRLVTERPGARARTFVIDGVPRRALSIGATEHFALPALHPALLDVEVCVGGFGPAAEAARAVTLGASLVRRVPGVRAGLSAVAERLLAGGAGGPDPAARHGTGTLVIAQALDGDDRMLGEVRLAGANVYDVTAAMLAWSAHAVAAGRLRARGGAHGPVAAFGAEALEEGLRASGIQRI